MPFRIEELGGLDYIIKTFKYIHLSGAIQDEQKFVQMVEEELSPEIGDPIMTLAEIYKKKGMQKGIQESKRIIAYRLIAKGYAVTEVMKITGLSLQEINTLQTIENETAG